MKFGKFVFPQTNTGENFAAVNCGNGKSQLKLILDTLSDTSLHIHWRRFRTNIMKYNGSGRKYILFIWKQEIH